MRERIAEAEPRHKAVMDDLKSVLAKHSANLSSYEMLAITSQLVGQLLALQDQTARSNEAYLMTMTRNIEEGNAMAIDTVFSGMHQTKQ